jgi:tRNA-dihydrouridine synthase A
VSCRACARGTRFYAIARHILGLFHAVPGARAFRRHIATEDVKPGAGPHVLEQALALVADVAPHAERTRAA